MATWRCGYVGMWLSGYVALWLSVCGWECGYVITLIFVRNSLKVGVFSCPGVMCCLCLCSGQSSGCVLAGYAGTITGKKGISFLLLHVATRPSAADSCSVLDRLAVRVCVYL